MRLVMLSATREGANRYLSSWMVKQDGEEI